MEFNKSNYQGSQQSGYQAPAPPQPYQNQYPAPYGGQYGMQPPSYGMGFQRPDESRKSGMNGALVFFLAVLAFLGGLILGSMMKQLKGKINEFKPKIPFRPPAKPKEPAKGATNEEDLSLEERHRIFRENGFRDNTDGFSDLDNPNELNDEE